MSEVIEGVYCNKMKYKRTEGMTQQEFYDMNEDEIEWHIKGWNRQHEFDCMRKDIITND